MPRRGFTLIEMIVALTVGSTLVGIAVSVLFVLMRAERTGRERVQQASVSARMAEQFRNDVAAALRPVPVQGDRPNQWQFALAGDRSVTYRALPEVVEREESEAGKLVRRESYVLLGGCTATIAVESHAVGPLASLVIARDGGRDMRVTAVMGKDHRFSRLALGGR